MALDRMTGVDGLDPVIAALIVAAFILLFASAAFHKWRQLHRFEEIFTAYGLLSDASAHRLYWLVPVLETAIAGGLLLDTSRRSASAAGAGLLLAYAAAMALNLRRGRRDIACGCGGPDERRSIAAWMVWRNALLAALLATALWPVGARALTWTDGITIGAGLMVATLIYASLDRLGAVAQRVRATRAAS